MLARRFTIVCLLVAIFGMSVSMLVAETSRTGHGIRSTGLACDVIGLARCIR